MNPQTITKTAGPENTETFRYDALRAEIWKLAAEKNLTEDILIQRLLGTVGRSLGLDRASFLCQDLDKKEYYTKLQWYRPECGSTLGAAIPYNLAGLFLGQAFVEIPKDLTPGAKSFADENFKRHGIQSYLVLPYGDLQSPTGLFTFTDCNEQRTWDEPTKNILAELVQVVAIRAGQIKSEETLRESEERFRLLFEHSNDAVFIHDLQGKILDVNKRACELLGYARDELIKIPLTDLHAPIEGEPRRQALEQTRAQGHIRFESRFKQSNGSALDVEISARVVDPKKGLVQGIVRDMTERNQAFLMLQKAKQQAEAANQAKNEFIANMTHELRTPISGAIGMLDLTLETALNTDQREYLEMAKYSVTALMSIINDILDFAKIETGNLVLQPVPFQLSQVLETVLISLAPVTKAKNLSLQKDLAQDVPDHLIGDPRRLQQIILKLAQNAVKFTKKGEVFLTVRRSKRPEDGYIMAHDPKKMVLHFMIRDTGIGIPVEQVNKIFNAFAQVDGSFARKYGGLGLGLTISQELVKMMDGDIWAESVEGKGSIFHFTAHLTMK